MADNNGVNITHGSVGTTAEVSHLTGRANQVSIINTHASQTLAVRVFTGETAAAAASAAATTVAVALADEVFHIPAAAAASGGTNRVVLFKSKRPAYVALSVLGSGASTTYMVHGTEWFD